MPRVIVDPTLLLDQLSDPWQGPQSGLVAKRFRATLQSQLDLAQVRGRQPRLTSAPAACLQARGAHLRQRGCPTTHGLPMHSNLSRHFRLTPACLQQLRRLQSAALQGFKVAFDSPRVSHEGTLHEKCQNVTIFCDHQ